MLDALTGAFFGNNLKTQRITNDKAGDLWNLIRWTSPRAIKNTFVPATAYGYPFLEQTEI